MSLEIYVPSETDYKTLDLVLETNKHHIPYTYEKTLCDDMLKVVITVADPKGLNAAATCINRLEELLAPRIINALKIDELLVRKCWQEEVLWTA